MAYLSSQLAQESLDHSIKLNEDTQSDFLLKLGLLEIVIQALILFLLV